MNFVDNLKVLVIILNLLTICANGNTDTLPVDMQTLSKDKHMPFNTIYYPSTYSMYPQEWMQTRTIPETEDSKTFNHIINSLNDLTEHEQPTSRAATKFAPLPFSKPLTYNKPSIVPWTSNTYEPNLGAPLEADLLKPKIGFLDSGYKPNKLGSLLNLGFTLLGGSGFKETLINNILRPLLASKGTLKSFIGKISIPVVALILVNIEILFVVWWLWEDCTIQASEPISPYTSQASVSNFSTSKSDQKPSLEV